jgi:hypothetical protein
VVSIMPPILIWAADAIAANPQTKAAATENTKTFFSMLIFIYLSPFFDCYQAEFSVSIRQWDLRDQISPPFPSFGFISINASARIHTLPTLAWKLAAG